LTCILPDDVPTGIILRGVLYIIIWRAYSLMMLLQVLFYVVFYT